MLDEIEVFVEVVEAGSFAAAARRRGVPKSTLSRAVDRLEDTLKARLLERSSRKLVLTDAGQAFVAQTAPHVAGLRDAAKAVGERSGTPEGTLRITAPGDVGEAFLAELLVRFLARHPLVRVDVDLSSQLRNLVEAGFDVGLRASTRGALDPTLVARRVTSMEAQLFASPAYLARRGTPRTPEELASHECVLFRSEDGRNELTLDGPDGTSSVTLSGRINGRDFSFVRAALRAGAGVGSLPAFMATEDLAAGRLVRVLPSFGRAVGVLFVVYPAARHVPRKVIAFRDFVLESLGGATDSFGRAR
ncbi:LysR family transcriptional regulator [Polyangium aurulentum]|uniref:LysR family transcriptional regulator n=1 Tax=Polyangium aurulentum TaxID=2567896 RepID=UPI0010AEDB72|nr:LysR family transcriptional regulator [Polyangium aurulentum]UQA57238.1 LysR family transcriptional regulator [Polyangium aurulentum]